MTVYSVSVKSKILITDKKTRLEDIYVRADDFRDDRSLNEFKKIYNEDKDTSEDHRYEVKHDWRTHIYYNLFEDMRRALLKWKKRRNRKKNKKTIQGS